ncbi:MAG: hypothetical protein RL616_2722 [Verrucomicrobiota bacterium]|jgi:hypothetical protein
MIAADPWQGGATWAVLQYVLGLRRLGHEVFFIEPIQPKALRPANASLADSDNARYFISVCDEFGLRDHTALLLAGKCETFGLDYAELQRVAARADLLLNISGLLAAPELTAKIPVRVYLDLDPAFNQLWHDVQKIDMRFAGHTHHVTIGQNIGSADCSVPTCGLDWLKTFQPVVLEHWPVARDVRHDALTTIANWRGYGSIHFNGVDYGQKVHSLRQFISLPTLTKENFLLALAIHPDETKDLAALKANRWQLIDPVCVANTPQAYAEFIRGSKAEFGLAKSGYVNSRCGWFSDRSVCYLASGRPVIAQDCGIRNLLPTGEGLFAFDTSDDVLAAIDALNSDYTHHAKHAREIAVEVFDSDKVLKRLLELVGL